ncbi:hypothetical protein OP658_002906 [Cronobacter sakazakii]|uniref:hypothetical protein n=1 Tax=Cronobacter sakazakii TaxID=28141 RepID=UPI000CF072F3|nr:hypothetical protein [Cronobacter sakazakii]EIX1656618.1 hypothetical protein [Cronobacter sakazakii]EIX1762583.1 hypothetical protein [Cronobacter sakazakii]EIX6120018.1 hypothetical protein [Cronobacter sakazakii]EIX6208632.1 hypothetical protein [Cronobacter sakazakii]EJQ0793809.1 hypothetical protein [Cronobacter sakazakii]
MKKISVNQAISRYNRLLRNPVRHCTVGELTALRMAAAQLLLLTCIKSGVKRPWTIVSRHAALADNFVPFRISDADAWAMYLELTRGVQNAKRT